MRTFRREAVGGKNFVEIFGDDGGSVTMAPSWSSVGTTPFDLFKIVGLS